MSKLIKLHLGCGKKKIHGYTNVDAVMGADIVDDCGVLGKFENNSASVIYNCHLLEHFKRDDILKVLTRWYDILAPDGVLRISTPDFRAITECYLVNGDIQPFLHMLNGDQKDEWNNHYVLFDEKYLTEVLRTVGFRDIKRYDWREIEDTYFIDDYSQSYWPAISYKTRRMDGEIGGKLLSLNIQAIK